MAGFARNRWPDSAEYANPTEALGLYQKVLSKTKIDNTFADYQKALSEDLDAFQESHGKGSFSQKSGLGIPEVYARQILALTETHLGLSRIYLIQKEWTKAETEATEAMSIAKRCEFCPYFISASLKKANALLETVYQRQGNQGKALICKLNTDLLDDHLRSDAGIEDFYLEKKVLLGEQGQQQVAAVEKLFESATAHQWQQNQAIVGALSAGAMMANAGLQQSLAQHALAQSGGIVTPQVQLAQMNAQIAMIGSVMFLKMAADQAATGSKTLEVNVTPWGIQTFSQQLVDPKQGANTPTIMKGFVSNAVQMGGDSYRAGAQQVTQAVDALMPYRQSGKIDGAAAQIEKFATVFNAFLTQVQELKK
ncbi:MAG: hypothetical protein OEY28_05080 [Nitrospira sp.]|nr:hypothetical protein [Nitrospira sp.]